MSEAMGGRAKARSLDYVFLVVNEVGNDKANDFASINYISVMPGFERNEVLVENAKMFFEHGMGVAAAYAVKRKAAAIFYTKRKIS